jgi:LasA protease
MNKRFLFLLFLFLIPALACSLSTAGPEQFYAPPSPVPGSDLGSAEEPIPWIQPVEQEIPFPTPEPPVAEPEPEEPPIIVVEAPPEPVPPFDAGAPPPPLFGDSDFFLYPAQSGDTLPAVANRFGVEPGQIEPSDDLPAGAYLMPGQLLVIPNQIGPVPYPFPVLPDSEIIYSPTAAGFDIHAYISQSGGYLSTHAESVNTVWMSGADIIRMIAIETSINPRLLLAFLEYRTGWVTGQPATAEQIRYPIGFYVPGYQGLYHEISLTAKMLTAGYYGWRSGDLLQLEFPGGSRARLAPGLNPGSVALQHLASKFYRPDEWSRVLYEPGGLVSLYEEMFGDPWAAASAAGPLIPAALLQPPLELPFLPGERWSYTGGPHKSWLTGSPSGAVDFAPVTGDPACAVSRAFTTASAAGVVTRSERSVVVIDLDGDGYENTGWALVYMHVAERDRVPAGAYVEVDQPIGRPSCEGGASTGTHIHFARKYNGEWLDAGGPVPFILSGWLVVKGPRSYEGFLIQGDYVVTARPEGSRSSIITR